MNLLILTDSDHQNGSIYHVSGRRSRHIREVLKLSVGDRLEAGILNGPTGKAGIIELDSDSIKVQFKSDANVSTPSDRTTDMVCALPRPQTVKKLLEIAGCWGVRKLDFVRANRVEKSYFHSPLLTPANMLPYLLEGMSQGKQTRLPEVTIHPKFRPFFEDQLLQRLDPGTSMLVPEPGTDKKLGDVLSADAKSILIAIGPEGGWVDFELETMQQLGFRLFRLAEPVLRVEHAATASLAQIELIRS